MNLSPDFSPIFCDWISAVIPVKNLPHLGRVIWTDSDGVLLRDVPRTHEMHRTSSSTMFKFVQISDTEIWMDGNLGRFNRHDNLFGYTVQDCMKFLPELLSSKGIEINGTPRLTKVDITENFQVGEGCVSRYTHWAAGQRLGRHKPTLYESGVAWGLGSKWWSAKIYDKNVDLKRTKRGHLAGLIGAGVARREITLKQKQLEKYDLENPDNWLEGTEEIIMNCIFKTIDKGGCSVEEIIDSNIPLRIENAIQAWRNGKDFVAAMHDGKTSRRTIYRLRKEILMVSGLDIFQPSDVRRLPVKVFEINPVRLEVPDWYHDYTRMAA